MLQHTLNNFIWHGKPPRVKQTTVCTMPSKAGMGAPNLKNYYKALLLNQAQHWWSTNSHPLWVQIEEAALRNSAKPLLAAIWLQRHPAPSFLATINATIKIWSSKRILTFLQGAWLHTESRETTFNGKMGTNPTFLDRPNILAPSFLLHPESF